MIMVMLLSHICYKIAQTREDAYLLLFRRHLAGCYLFAQYTHVVVLLLV